MNNWKKLTIGSFLRERPGRYDPSDKEVAGLKRLKKIDFSGEMHLGDKASKTDMIVAHPGDLVISGINVAKGAIAIYSGDAPVAATIHYSSYSFDEKQIDIEFFKWFIKSPLFEQTLKEQVRGGIKTEIKPKNFLPLEISLPDVKAQARIVSFFKKIETEMSDLQTEIDAQQLLIKRLRQQILQDAIEGKLTADWRKKNPALITGENHALKLLEKIKSDKSRLIQQGKLKKEKPLLPIIEAEKPFPLPEGWVWCRLDGDIAHVSTGATPLTSHKEYYNGGTLNWVTSSATNDLFICSSEKLITEKAIRETNCKIFPVGTLIIAMYGQGKTRGQISELNISAATNQACAALELYYCNETLKRYLKIFFLQQYDKLRALAFGGLQPNLNLTKIGETMIPLPPYEEQKRILVGVDNAMNRLDGLEKQCAERQSQSKMLMQSVLREAFETPVAANKHPCTQEQ